MKKIKQAKDILRSLGLPAQQCNEISAITLLALADLGKKEPWSQAKMRSLRIHDILRFAKTEYKRPYAENTRETVRRQVIHQFEQAGIVVRNPDEPDLPTNSPRTNYVLTDEVASLMRSFGTESWQLNLNKFLATKTTLADIYSRRRKTKMVPLTISSGKAVSLSPGKHNELQVAIVEQFAPRFAPGAILLHLGDTARKMLYCDQERLADLGMTVDEHNKLPDVVLYHRQANRLFLIEAVTSHGPVSPKRHYELEQMLSHVSAARIYVSAFPDFKEFKRHLASIAWETEVWLSEMPDHLIHFNGDKFLR